MYNNNSNNKNIVNSFFFKGDYNAWEKFKGSLKKCLLNYGVKIYDIDFNLLKVSYAKREASCDEFHFKIDDSEKCRHIGVYNNRVEYDYIF